MNYLKHPIGLLTLDTPLDPTLYRIADNPDQYRRGAYLPLTDEQAEFAKAHPAATPEEILNLAITPPTIDQLRASRLAEIDAYDQSPAVNSFTLDGTPMWLDKATRVGLANSIAIEAAAGRTTTTLWYANRPLTLPIPEAQKMLAALELYALESFNVTSAHRAAILALDTPEAISAYDITALYPQSLNLTSPCAEDN